MYGRSPSLLLCLMVVAGASPVWGGLSVVDRSPFIWPGFDSSEAGKPAARPSSSEDFEFHAVYELSGNIRVLLRDNKKNSFHWLEVGKEADGLRAISYDQKSNQLVFAYENQQKSLSLKELPKWVSTPLAAGAAPSTTTRQVQPTDSRSSSSSVRRRVIRPSSRTTTTRDSAVGGTTLSGGAEGPPVPIRRIPSRRMVNSDPGVEAPSFVPDSPGPAPTTEPPPETPPAAPAETPTRRP
ncbi:MAG: hypothetical protein ACO3ZW_09255 [Opitutales bacterium]|jgi:hypothetical protein